VVDVGRLVVTPAARAGRSHRIVGGLCARGWLQVVAHGCDRALSSATPDLIELYRGLGLRITVLGAARPYWGARRASIAIEGDEDSFAFLTDATPSGASRGRSGLWTPKPWGDPIATHGEIRWPPPGSSNARLQGDSLGRRQPSRDPPGTSGDRSGPIVPLQSRPPAC
jgi:hypothetical protein